MPGIAASPARTAVWRIGEDTGRRYARPSGDFNPIHLSAMSAKLFGFKRAIAHGMWAFARCLGECAEDLPKWPIKAHATFKRPIFLPSRVLFASYVEGGGLHLGLHTVDGIKPHVVGSVHAFDVTHSFL